MFDFLDLGFGDDAQAGGADFYHEAVDIDGDGIADKLAVDFDGDGVIDALTSAEDTNGDGLIDTALAYVDIDKDGEIDTLVVANDYDQDGTPENYRAYGSTRPDGEFNVFVRARDLDEDGRVDDVKMYVDEDGDGRADAEFENVFSAPARSASGLADGFSGAVNSTYADELNNFEPDNADPDSVYGDPGASMEHWDYQGETNRCALYSQKFVIEEITGREVDIEELADVAKDYGWFSEEGGTPVLNMSKLLDHYGIEHDMSFNNTVDDLRECLADGKRVIVSVDADEIWYAENDLVFSPADGPNHAVQVIGIDESDPDAPMAILNDSGNPNGRGSLVPLDTFQGAWEDGDCQMIAC